MKSLFNQKHAFLFVFLLLVITVFSSCKNDFHPVLTTQKPTMTTTVSAATGGYVEDENGLKITALGVCWGSNPSPTIKDNTTSDGTGPGKFTSTISGLNPGETYYIRAYMRTNIGVWYGNEWKFLTPTIPVVSTGEINFITQTSATGPAVLTSDGNSAIISSGVYWGTQINPTFADRITISIPAKDSFYYKLTGLTEGTSYYIRAYATNIMGTAYGNSIKITVPAKTSDFEGNSYNTVQIGSQIWMAENLKSTKNNDGSPLTEVTVDQSWLLAYNIQAYCNYSNDVLNGEKYGKLYNWYAVNSTKLAPIGWHIPSYEEWNVLIDYVSKNAGTSLIYTKSIASATDWEVNTIDGTIGNNRGINNFSYFNALPGGYRDNYGNFLDIGKYCGFWCTNSSTSSMWFANYKYFRSDNNYVSYTEFLKSSGLSIRCIKNY